MSKDITVCIPSIPNRSKYLSERAVPSALAQTLPVSSIAITMDYSREGAWDARNRALSMVTTTWIGFLDDDDELLPHHFQTLMDAAISNDADVVWGWFKVIGGTDPFPAHRGRQWEVSDPHIFPITCLVRNELVVESFARFASDDENTGSWGVQDLPFWMTLHNAGAKFLAIPDVTWNWYHHGSNTSGLGTRY